MLQTKNISPEILQKLRGRKWTPFRFKTLDADTIIITNDIGRFCFLSHAEFKTFLDGTITGEKRKELEEKFFFEMDTTVLAREYAKKHTFLAVGPNLHILMTTLRCNHTCRYCQSSVFPMEAKEVDLDRQTAKKIIDTAFFSTAPAIVIEFQGGEPLSNWEILQFSIEYAEYKSEQTQKKVGFALVTNMSLMTLEKLEYLLDHQIGVTTSLDGDEETHNFNRIYTKGNAHKITTDWIREIDRVSRERTGNKYPILPVLTVTRKTLENWKACIDEYIQLWIPQIFWRPLNPIGFAANTFAQIWYTPEEYIETYKKVLDYIIECNLVKKIQIKEAYASMFLKKILSPSDPNYTETRSPCGAVISQVAYNFDGKIYSCDEGRMLSQMGDDSFCVWEVNDDARGTYAAMINSPITKAILSASVTDGLPGYEYDAYLPYLGSCPILNYRNGGNVYPNYTIDTKRKIESGILDYVFLKMRGNPEVTELFQSWV